MNNRILLYDDVADGCHMQCHNLSKDRHHSIMQILTYQRVKLLPGMMHCPKCNGYLYVNDQKCNCRIGMVKQSPDTFSKKY